jgi:hypothetical protein
MEGMSPAAKKSDETRSTVSGRPVNNRTLGGFESCLRVPNGPPKLLLVAFHGLLAVAGPERSLPTLESPSVIRIQHSFN